MAEAEKRTVIISGNCHGRFLRRSLTRTIGQHYEVVWARHLGFRGQDPVEEEALTRARFVLAQVGHLVSEMEGSDRLPADCRTIRFPVTWLNSLWPTHAVDPRNPNRGPDDRGPFPFGDRLIMRFLEEGASPQEAVERWFEADPGQAVNLDRFHEINAAKALQLDLEADVKLGAFVLDNFRRERLFVTYNHPSAQMLLHMARQLCEAMGFAGVEPVLPKVNREGVGEIQVPVHPKVAAHFALEWFDPEALYRYFEERLSAREYMLRYAAFAPMPSAAAE
jgi:hypothetical protein